MKAAEPATALERFTEFARRIVAVPKAEVDEKAREYAKTRKKRRRNPR
jgi:hypothetical protein